MDCALAAAPILDPESCETVLCIPGGTCGAGGACPPRLNGYRHGDFGTSFWKARLSKPTLSVKLVSFVFDDKRLKKNLNYLNISKIK